MKAHPTEDIPNVVAKAIDAKIGFIQAELNKTQHATPHSNTWVSVGLQRHPMKSKN